MAKKELFQSVINNMLEQIRLDALDCLNNPPEKEVDTYTAQDLEEKALEYHTKGEVGTYLYFMSLLELKLLDRDISTPPSLPVTK